MAFKRVGIIGSGQLGRMMALAGTPLDVDFIFFDEAKTSPCSHLGPMIHPSGDNALRDFISSVDVVTYESENTSLELVREINQQKPVYPAELSLSKSQHRLTEKAEFNDLGIDTAKFKRVTTKQNLIDATTELGFPIVVKTTTMGYDGKGQAVIKANADIDDAWEQLGDTELIAESFVNFSRELSVIAARAINGDIQIYPIAENIHEDGILRVSRVPVKNLCSKKEQQAKDFITLLLNHLNHVGVLTLELFDCEDGLVANEMAPRVHNSGHWSIEGSYCSQFENHVRAICGMPLGNPEAKQAASAMINIIGKNGDRNCVLANSNAHLHMYGKSERLNRKLGHINVFADTDKAVEESLEKLAAFIKECG
jgi:5-(carboxyamino)imidazole ribonucleotide synthase